MTGGLANADAACAEPARAHAAGAGASFALPRRLASRALLLLLVPLTGCEWFSDFKKQPVIYPWESGDTLRAMRGNPQGSVPFGGMAVSAMEVSYRPLPGVIDSMAGLVNPTASSAASLANGRMYYQINCAVCHGDAGRGDGPVTKYGMPAIGLVGINRADGYIFGMIRNGRGLMPPYNRIEEMDRWDVVNYVRALQAGGSVGGVATGPLAEPGVTGDKVPGPTRIGPARPSPYFNSPHLRAPRDGSSAAAAMADTTAPDSAAHSDSAIRLAPGIHK